MQEGRRNLLKGFAGISAAGAWFESMARNLRASDAPAAESNERSSVKDRLWLWGHVAGSHNQGNGLPGASRMTPAEAAFYLDVPNLLMVEYEDPKDPYKMLPEHDSYDQYAMSFRPLKRVVWSIIGAGGPVNRHDRVSGNMELVRKLAPKFPNIVGVQLDDFFQPTLEGGMVGVLTPKELAYIRSQLEVDGRKLDLWVTLYYQNLEFDLAEYLNEVDVVTYWTSPAKELDTLEEGFPRAEKAAPRARKVLGCYMWDYGTHQPMPIPLMQKQCEIGLQWLRKGRIAGIIFLASCICDLNIEAVEWTRNWIREVGNERI